jgi:transposase
MNLHQNARLMPSGRERLVRLAQSGLSPKVVAETMGVCLKTVGKWVARFEAEGAAGLQDRSSRPHTLHRPTPVATQEAIVTLRRQRLTGAQIARDLAVPPATVSRVLRRYGLSRMRDLGSKPHQGVAWAVVL